MQRSADRLPFLFLDELTVQGLVSLGFFCIQFWGGLFAFLALKKNNIYLYIYISTFLLFKVGLLDERDNIAGQDAHTRCVRMQKSRKEALSPEENVKEQEQCLLEKVNSSQGNTTRLPPSLSSSPCKSWCGGHGPEV